MSTIELDPRLTEDCHLLGWLDTTALLLMRNALFPWFVLVPETDEIEFYKLEPQLQIRVIAQINLLSKFIECNYQIDKLNIGSIGNIVSQLHVHVIGRNREDACWPGVVWGVKNFAPYASGEVENIVEKLALSMHGAFRVDPARAHNQPIPLKPVEKRQQKT